MRPGSRLGPYRIVSRLGSGGMGDVYLAEDPRLEREVALKVLTGSADQDTDADTLLREARMISALRHAHICAVYDVGVDADPPYIAMEFVEGEPLNRVLAQGPVPLESAVRYGAEIADALGHAHDKGVNHRDLKAANVMIDAEGACRSLLRLAAAGNGDEPTARRRLQAIYEGFDQGLDTPDLLRARGALQTTG